MDIAKVIEVILTTFIALVIAIVATLGAVIWFSITWPWYLWKGIFRAAHPR